MGESKRRKQTDPNYGKSKRESFMTCTGLIQPKKGIGKLVIGTHEFDSEWAALGISNIELSIANQKGFLLVKTSSETYAFIGSKPFEKIVDGFSVKPGTPSNTGWQWKLAVVKMILISSNNESFDFEGEIVADRKRGFKDAYIFVKGNIKTGIYANYILDFEFKQLQELPPIGQKFIFD